MSSPVDEAGEARLRPTAAPAGGDRLDALEQQVRQLTSRLAGWVEAQLVQALDDRREDMKALRAELQAVVNEQLAGVRAEAASVLSVATRRLQVAQEQLGERLDAVAARSADAAAHALAVTGQSVADAERLEILEEYVGDRLAVVRDEMRRDLRSFAEEQAKAVALLRNEVAEGPSRVEGFEQRMRAAMVRLTDAFEARLVEIAGARDSALQGVRAELVGRLDALGLDAAKGAEALASVQESVAEAAARTAALDREVDAAVARLTEAFEVQVGHLESARAGDLSTLRAEATDAVSSLGARIDEVATRSATVAGEVAVLRDGYDASASRTEELEQRVKAAVGRLAESVEGRLGELARAQSADAEAMSAGLRATFDASAAELRAELETASSGLRSRFGPLHERLDAIERQQRDAGKQTTELIETRLADVVERRRVEFDGLRQELEESVAAQLRDGRSEIGTVVSDAHRRFVVSVDALQDRMNDVAEQSRTASGAVAGLETLRETVVSDGRRIEALEIHTRRTDARLGEVVAAKLGEVAGQRDTELSAMREDLRTSVDSVRVHLRSALDSHLAETREEVTLALGQARADVAAGAAQLRQAEGRLGEAVAAKLAEVDVAASRVGDADAAVTALAKRVAKALDESDRKVAGLTEQVGPLVKAARAEAGALAPLRSDVRHLQAQVAELGELVAELRPKRKAVAAKPAPVKKTAPVKKAAPAAKKAVPAKKAPAPRRRPTQ